MSNETIFTNAVLVLPDDVIHGTLVMRDDIIAAIETGPSALPAAIDLDGDYLIPGVVDVHTDNLERQVLPRSLARWPLGRRLECSKTKKDRTPRQTMAVNQAMRRA